VPKRSPWLRTPRPEPAARLRLICLPFAGGAASTYRGWAQALPPEVEVCAVQLPGREDRFGEPALADMDALTEGLAADVAGSLDRPFAVFGHSMGALIGFELVARLGATGREPVCFFASGCPAPHLPLRVADRHALPDDRFLESVGRLNGIRPEVMANPELLALLLPTIRSDFTLVGTYHHRARPPLGCPVVALGGDRDAEVTAADLEAWSVHAAGAFHVHLLPGDHFYLVSAQEALLRIVGDELAPYWAVT
jgi:surfactin synthase thioesterase subunit